MTVILAVVALLLSGGALAFAVAARRDAAATRGELQRHRHSHTLQRPEEPARRHSERPGPPPVADPDAAPPTAEIGAMRPPRRRVREDPQA
jgi:hypothetical protein